MIHRKIEKITNRQQRHHVAKKNHHVIQITRDNVHVIPTCHVIQDRTKKGENEVSLIELIRLAMPEV